LPLPPFRRAAPAARAPSQSPSCPVRRYPSLTTGSRTSAWASSRCPSSTRSGWSDATLAWASGSARSWPMSSPHPLDPASAEEYLAGRDIMAAAGLLPEGDPEGARAPVSFAYYGLEEPPKDEVLAAAAADRRLRAFLVDTASGESTDVVVSLTRNQVVSARTLDPVKDGQMPILD